MLRSRSKDEYESEGEKMNLRYKIELQYVCN